MDASQRNLYETFIGERNSGYYLAKFEHFDKLGGGLHASWNWPAFISPAWALYRKMYGWFFTMWLLTAVMSGFAKVTEHFFLVLVPIMAFSAFANSLYHRHVKIKIAQTKKGGVNMWVPWVATSLPVIGILAAIVIPAMTSAPKALTPAVEVNPFATPPVQAAQPVSPPVNAARFAKSPTASTQAWLDRNPWFNTTEYDQATRQTRAIDKQMHDEGWVENENYFTVLDRRLLEAGVVVQEAKPTVDWTQYSPAN